MEVEWRVWSGECGVWSVWSVKCEVWSGECESVECGMCGMWRKVWSVKCGV